MDLDRLKQRINALRDKTTANGCTEAEAMAAAAKAADLMREAGLSELDLEIHQSSARCDTRGQAPESRLWTIIALCTNCAFVLECDQNCNRLTFIGKEPGPEIAAYLWVVCDRAIKKAVRDFRKSTFYRRRRSKATKRQAVSDFKLGMAIRLQERLLELFKGVANRKELEASIHAKEELFPNLEAIKKRSGSVRFHEVVASGFIAAKDVNLSHGVDGASQQKQLAGAS
ncbi:hypothetical protein FIV06_09125 [Labrenzia sp. THAF191b]|uniref:DUF7168 domain-containing protein n=1 Tax=unclassified Labrenzia TaxID=2648686 RepID=UPI00126798C2|nr:MULTISPECIES: DUF2786 domain-containing protein [unclassified Labrenzia]QFS97582.1 hypothetical protein FIV06_09125 [Labrenzia sp. THAF191b]QFT03897.1 hypothetical protein FIV05_09125 [Labrenzia sp. THAF191a]QFT15439.1 hypothetical protein FIV03_09130 [Labrenzia sp. THAF187b]